MRSGPKAEGRGPRSSPGHRGDGSAVLVSCRGFTLVETLISLALMSILMSACVGVILLATRGLPAHNDGSECNLDGTRAVQRLATDLQYATAITDLRTTGISFEVHDRGHGAAEPAEAITYAWSGAPGSPLTRSYNDNPAANQLDAVQSFQIAADRQDTAVLAVRIQLTVTGGETTHVLVRLQNAPEDLTP